MLLIMKPTDLLKKNHYDFFLNKNNNHNEFRTKNKLTKKIDAFLENFEILTLIKESKKNLNIITEISIKYLNNSLYYKYTVKINENVILIKVESDSDSSELFKYLYSNTKLNDQELENSDNDNNPYYLLRFDKDELITVLYEKDIYLTLLDNE